MSEEQAPPRLPAGDVEHRAALLSQAEIAECQRDLAFALLMPIGPARQTKVAGVVAGIQRAIGRLGIADRSAEAAPAGSALTND